MALGAGITSDPRWIVAPTLTTMFDRFGEDSGTRRRAAISLHGKLVKPLAEDEVDFQVGGVFLAVLFAIVAFNPALSSQESGRDLRNGG